MRFFRRSPQVQEPVDVVPEPADLERTEEALERTRKSWFGRIAGLFGVETKAPVAR